MTTTWDYIVLIFTLLGFWVGLICLGAGIALAIIGHRSRRYRHEQEQPLYVPADWTTQVRS